MPDQTPTQAIAATAVAGIAAGQYSETVSMETARYRELEMKRALPRALMGGTEAMRAARQTYMPQHPAEKDTTYDLRLKTTVLYGAFEETVKSEVGKMFMKPITLQDNVAPQIVDITTNIDGQGRALTPFANDVMKLAMVDGISFILVDSPKLPEGATQADAKTLKARPYWCLVPATSLIGVRDEAVGGQQVLTQIRIKETVAVSDGEYGEKIVRRIRVMKLDPATMTTSFELWEAVKTETGEKWMLMQSGALPLKAIPLVPVYTNRVGYMEGEPPLRSLADLCQEHWASSSEQRHALSFARFAMLCVTGVTDTAKITVGPDKIIGLPTGADAKYIESTGAAISAGAADLKDIEGRMTTTGMTLRIEQAGGVTATASAIDSAETNAALKAVCQGLEDALDQALQITADYLRVPNGGNCDVYDEFAEEPPVGDAATLLAARVAREMSQETYWAELQRRHILSDEFDAEKEKGLLAAEPPPAPLPLPAPAKPAPAPAPAPNGPPGGPGPSKLPSPAPVA